MTLPNPTELDALLAVLRARGATAFEVREADGSGLTLRLEPVPDAPPASLVEVIEPPAPGGWKTR